MVLYRRNRVPGGTYFFTVTLRDRNSSLLIQHVDLLRGAVRRIRELHPFGIVAMVVLPDHLHAIWRLPEGDADYANRWRGIKRRFTEDVVKRGVPIVRNRKGEHDLWQRRYWEHMIRDDEDLHRHVDYVHFNPVKHGLVNRVADWPHSSFHRCVARGLLSSDWAGDASTGEFGEP